MSSEGSGSLDDGGSRGWLGRVLVGNSMNNHVIRGHPLTRDVRKEWRTNDRFLVKVSNVSHYHLKDGVFVGGFGDNLVKVRTDIKEVLDIEIILISTTDEGTAGIGGLQYKIVDTNVLNKFGLLLAVGRTIEGADDNFLYRSWFSRLDKAPADLNILRNMDWKFR